MTDLITEARELCEKKAQEEDFFERDPAWIVTIPRLLDYIDELCDALEKAQEQIESVHKALDFAETQRQRSKNYTELAINNGLALGRIAVTIQHDFETLTAVPEEGE